MKLSEKYLKIIEVLLTNSVLPRGYTTSQFNRFIKLISLLKLEIPLVKSIPRGAKAIIDHYNENTGNFDTHIECKEPNTL